MIFEDEHHFLLICSSYHDLRKSYINKYYIQPNNLKYINLLSTENVIEMRKMVMYVEKDFKGCKSATCINAN